MTRRQPGPPARTLTGGLASLTDIEYRMIVTVNGEPRQIADGAKLTDLLRALRLSDQPCAVEVNKEVVPRRAHADSTLRQGDEIEIVTLVGGG